MDHRTLLMERLTNLHKHLFKHKALSSIAITEGVIIVFLIVYIFSLGPTTLIKAQSNSEADNQINHAVFACNKLPPVERPSCAKAVGIQVQSLFGSPEDKTKQCMKLFPLLVRYCQEEAFVP